MSLTATLIYSNRRGNIRPGNRQRYTDVYHVSGWDPSDDDDDAIWAASGLPEIGNVISGVYTDLYCIDLESRSLDPTTIWEVRATWQESPLYLPVVVHEYGMHRQEAVWKDINDRLPCNSAGDPYNPPLERMRGISRYEITRRYSMGEWEMHDPVLYLDHTNLTPFTVHAADDQGDDHLYRTCACGQAYMDDIRAVMLLEPIFHVQVTFVVLVETDYWKTDDGQPIYWNKLVPDAGPRYTDANGQKKHFQSDTTAVQWNGTGLLDGSGGKLASDATTPKYRDFEIIHRADFNNLNMFTVPTK